MYMRGKFFILMSLTLAVLLLTSCTQVISSPSDEIRMFRWHGEYENGNAADLSFSDNDAVLSLTLSDHTTEFSGLCVTTDDRLIICDKTDGSNYAFGYRLFGDRVELSYNGAVLTLDKVS